MDDHEHSSVTYSHRASDLRTKTHNLIAAISDEFMRLDEMSRDSPGSRETCDRLQGKLATLCYRVMGTAEHYAHKLESASKGEVRATELLGQLATDIMSLPFWSRMSEKTAEAREEG